MYFKSSMSVLCNAVLFQDQKHVTDMSLLPADTHPESYPAVSATEACSPKSAGWTFDVTRSSTAVVTSQSVVDTTSVISQQPTMQLNSRVTLAELQPTMPAPVTTDMSHELKTCFTSPSTNAVQSSDGSSRTTYGPMQISAQVLSLPRSITNCRNLSRPLTLCYAGRQVIVPPSCIVLGAEGAKLLLPPQTIVPSKPLPHPLDLSCDSTVFHDKSTSTSPSKSRSASETAPSDKTDSLLQEHKEESVTDECTMNIASAADRTQSPCIAEYSAEAAGEQVLSDNEDQSTTDQYIEADISKLSDVILIRIFTFLHLNDLLRVRCVCSHWNSAANKSLLVNRRFLLFLLFSKVEESYC